MIHALITFVICGTMLLFNLPWIALFWPPFFYLGREIAQAEYRYIEAHGGKRANCPSWCGFIPSAWTLKGLLDWALPMLVSSAFAFAHLKGII